MLYVAIITITIHGGERYDVKRGDAQIPNVKLDRPTMIKWSVGSG